MGFKFDASSLQSGLESMITRSEAALWLYAETAALKLEGYMKDKAPWTDRTGMARQSLTGRATRVTFGFKITLSHGVNYGKWLELAREKKHAIIQPTITVNTAEVMAGLNNLLGRIK